MQQPHSQLCSKPCLRVLGQWWQKTHGPGWRGNRPAAPEPRGCLPQSWGKSPPAAPVPGCCVSLAPWGHHPLPSAPGSSLLTVCFSHEHTSLGLGPGGVLQEGLMVTVFTAVASATLPEEAASTGPFHGPGGAPLLCIQGTRKGAVRPGQVTAKATPRASCCVPSKALCSHTHSGRHGAAHGTNRTFKSETICLSAPSTTSGSRPHGTTGPKTSPTAQMVKSRSVKTQCSTSECSSSIPGSSSSL